ncbi:hypothetical protein [Helicobacter cetorum]|uniref:hypothetical protein n=1 Tax=Helicobacter cetorum TaxID=138563 RepID=UPI000CF0499C|nr:hypothetical protein [Helicobacter cetorum]
MKLHKRILRLHHFRNLGKDLPTELLLNVDFDEIKHGGLVILVGENNVGKSNVLEGLKAFNDETNYLCEDYEKQAKEKATLSLITTIENNQQLETLSWVELKENQANKQAFEMSFYPFENHMKTYKASNENAKIPLKYSPKNFEKIKEELLLYSPKNFDNHFIQSIRESLETLLPCADDSLSHNKYCQELENSWHNFFNQYEKTLRLNEIFLRKYIMPIERKKDKRKAKVAYKNLKKALLLHICLTFKEYSLSKMIERFDENKVCETLEKMRKKSKEQNNKIAIQKINYKKSNENSIEKHLSLDYEWAFLFDYLPKIIDCDNPFELQDKDLYIDILKGSTEKKDWNGIWHVMCEWYEIETSLIYNFIFKILDTSLSVLLLDKRGNSFEELNSKLEEVWHGTINFKIDNNKMQISFFEKTKGLRIDLQEKSMNEFGVLESPNDWHVSYLKNIECNQGSQASKIKIFLNKKCKTIVFNFYDSSEKFLFCKKTNLLYELKKELKKMGEKISKEFNESYCINPNDEHRYIFEFRLKKQRFLHIRIKRDNEYLELDKQSTGFQWFFNLFFNFLYPYKYHKKGVDRELEKNISYDNNNIVVMDEPATSLSVPARQEFRERLRRYGKKRGITFVLATHDPFLVDTNHLDEIRIVERRTNGSVIHNEFNYSLNNASKNSDALDKIKRSLGVGQHVFYNHMKNKIIFVEGITDYCYLSAFKLYFNKHVDKFKKDPINITFLPISGLKNNTQNMETTIDKLCELDSNPIVLIDDDRKDKEDDEPSEDFKQANKELEYPIKILQLSQCNENFKQIEDLFSDEDKQEYSLESKNRELAIAFKNKLYMVSHKLNNKRYQYPLNNQDVISKQAEINFLYLFEWIACNLSSVKN